MKSKPKQQSNETLVRTMPSREVRQWIRQHHFIDDPEYLLSKAGEVIAKGNAGQKTDQKDIEVMNDALMLTGHERHHLAVESVTDERLRPMIADLANCIQQEYGCVASSEVALASLAAVAYYRALKASRKISALFGKNEIGMVGVGLIAQVSKEADRGYRQYFTAIETLRMRRQPQLNVRIQTKAAFFGENQTFQANTRPPYENNDAQ